MYKEKVEMIVKISDQIKSLQKRIAVAENNARVAAEKMNKTAVNEGKRKIKKKKSNLSWELSD
jgi:hypothetical protein